MIARRFTRRDARSARERPSRIIAFAAGLSLATVTLIALAWTATAEMRRSTNLLLERRASEVLALTSAALNRDMKGAWLSVLAPMDAIALEEDPPYDILQLTSRAFARFPYPESFIVWRRGDGRGERTYAFNRSDRPVPWADSDEGTEAYPVALLRDPPALEPIVALVRQAARDRRRFAVVEATLSGVPYQVIAQLLFTTPDQHDLSAFVAFTVNLPWVRAEYLDDLLRQVATIDGEEDAMAIAVLDEGRRIVADSGVVSHDTPLRQRPFPLLFVEPSLVRASRAERPSIRMWTIQVRPAPGASRAASALGAQMLLLASLAGVASLVAVLLTVRAVRAGTELATMKSDFVAAVTHELKTPVSLIKLVGETLERGRYSSPDTIHDYAAILSQEARRLDHLIENLLTYSRLSDLRNAYTFEPVDLADLVDDALAPFRPRLKALGFDVRLELAPDLPQVRADRAAIVQAFANVIDNAIKYSPERRHLRIAAHVADCRIALAFEDHGAGIPAEEIDRVFDKFYRGRGRTEFGSGLGLAIVSRIVREHRGTSSIASTPGLGTTVTVSLPIVKRA